MDSQIPCRTDVQFVIFVSNQYSDKVMIFTENLVVNILKPIVTFKCST